MDAASRSLLPGTGRAGSASAGSGRIAGRRRISSGSAGLEGRTAFAFVLVVLALLSPSVTNGATFVVGTGSGSGGTCPDGGGDSTCTLPAALAASEANNNYDCTGGGVGSGTRDTITFEGGLTSVDLSGIVLSFNEGGVTVDGAGTVTLTKVGGSDAFDINSCANRLEELTITGSGTNVDVDGDANSFCDNTWGGASGGPSGSTGIDIDGAGNVFGTSSIFADHRDCATGNILDASSVNDGIDVAGDANIVNGNTIDDAGQDAIEMSGGTLHSVSFNVINNPGQSGIETSSNAVFIIANTIDGAGDAGIFMSSAFGVLVDGNTVINGLDHGILMGSQSDRTLVFDNIVGTVGNGNAGSGIDTNNASRTCIQGNIITDNGGSGIHIDALTEDAIVGHEPAPLAICALPDPGSLPPGVVVGPPDNGEPNVATLNNIGVQVGGGTGTQGIRVSRNSTFANTGLGIDNGGDGPDGNDFADGVTLDTHDDDDNGPNLRQNSPQDLAADIATGPTGSLAGCSGYAAGDLLIEFSVFSAGNSSGDPTSPSCSGGNNCSDYDLTIEFFKADADGQEGQTWLAEVTYDNLDAGTVVCVNLGPANALGLSGSEVVSVGDVLVASAIDTTYHTSEFSAGVTTTPVTLGSFEATRRGDVVRFEWTTAAEMGNVGFDLWVRGPVGWMKVNPQLIPSRVIDSSAPQFYVYEASVEGDSFRLEDVDLMGTRTSHGPFQEGRSYGSRAMPRRIDWAPIQEEHQWKRSARLEALSERWSSLTEGGRGTEATYPTYELLVSEDGLHRVTYEDLAAAGLDLAGVPVGEIALTRRAVPVKIRVHGPGETFGAGGFIDFLGEASKTLYTDTEVYRLTVDATKALRMLNVGGEPSGSSPTWYPETVEIDNDLIYDRASPTGEPWIDSRLVSVNGVPASKDFVFEVDYLVPGIHPGFLEVDLYGGSWFNHKGAPDHHMILELNGVEVADEVFNGLSRFDTRFRLPAGALQEGTNTFTLSAIADLGYLADVIALNTYGASYARAPVARSDRLEFTAKGSSMRVSGFNSDQIVAYASLGDAVVWLMNVNVSTEGTSYEAHFRGHPNKRVNFSVSAVDAIPTPGIQPARPYTDITSGPADYLILTHADFESDLGAVVSAREALGLTVETVVVDDVYAQFSHGNFDAAAIRTYLGTIADAWGLEYVLFVGGDTTDYLGQVSSSISFIPTIYVPTHPVVQYTPSDPAMTDWDGDGIPNLAHGRLPVRNSEELATVIQKILDYPTAGHAGSLVFAADNPDRGTSFSAISESFAATAAGSWTIHRAYLSDAEAATVAAANATLTSAINGGAAMVNFLGHSSFSVWTFDGLFDTGDAAVLTNFGQPTIVTQWGCWNTYHVDPDYDTMSHILMLDGAHGAAAALGASTLTTVFGDQSLGPRVLQKIISEGMPIGKAVQEAKQEIAGTEALIDVIYGWTLLGDPAMTVLGPGGS